MFKKLGYILGLFVFSFVAFFILKSANLSTFVDSVENRSFDLRQAILINNGAKEINPDIMIVAIDDATYEYILDNYGISNFLVRPASS